MEGLRVTSRLKEALTLMGRLDVEKFALFLEGVLTGLERTGAIFTAAELKKLEGILGLSSLNLGIVVQACAYLFEQAARQRSAGLTQALEAAGLEASRAACFGKVWEDNGARLVAHLKEKPVSERTWLRSFEWKSEVPLGSSQEAPRKPGAQLRLELSEGTSNLAFSREELHRFFMDLEVIQAQLDSLSSS